MTTNKKREDYIANGYHAQVFSMSLADLLFVQTLPLYVDHAIKVGTKMQPEMMDEIYDMCLTAEKVALKKKQEAQNAKE